MEEKIQSESGGVMNIVEMKEVAAGEKWSVCGDNTDDDVVTWTYRDDAIYNRDPVDMSRNLVDRHPVCMSRTHKYPAVRRESSDNLWSRGHLSNHMIAV
jgi:hypothetical protein